jgi:uncharacterized protein (DUF58 family)
LRGPPGSRFWPGPRCYDGTHMRKSASPLLNKFVIIAGFGALVGAAWAGYTALVVLLGLALSAVVVTRVWSWLCLKGVTCERRLSVHRAFPGDEVLLTLRVVNRKILPLPWVEIQDQMPASLVPEATPGDAAEEPGVVSLSRSTPLLWYSAASFTHRLNASARGYYPLGPLNVTSGDIFGLQPDCRVQPEVDHLIVYPRTYTLADLGVPSLSNLGDAKSEQRVFDDPSRLMGVREYVPGDSRRRIHWKASARSGALQVKLFEFTTDLKVDVFLAIDTFVERPAEDLELGISTAASVARHLLERDVQTGLFANTRLADTHHPARVAAGGGTAHLALILEALAKTTADVDVPFLDFFDRERDELGFGGTLVFVVGEVSTEIELLTADLARVERNVLGFHIGQHSRGTHAPGVRWNRISHPATSGPEGAAAPSVEADSAEAGSAEAGSAEAAVA